MNAGRISARKDPSNVIVSCGPDVCWTPRGGSMQPVAYDSIAFLSTATRISTSVRNNGNYDFQLNSRCATSKGTEPGIGRGVVRPGWCGPAHVQEGSDYCYSEGYATCSHQDPAWINGPDEGPMESQKSETTEEV